MNAPKKILLIISTTLYVILALFSACEREDVTAAATQVTARSQEKIEAESRMMKYYYDTYSDLYAAMTLRRMFEAGEINADENCGDYAAAGDGLSANDMAEFYKISCILNCRLIKMTQKELLKGRLILTDVMKSSPVLISLFDGQEERDKVENAVKIIDRWEKTPENENTAAMEEAVLSDKLTCGEKVYLYYYVCAVGKNVETVSLDNKKYETAYYIENRFGGSFSKALYELLVENNKPKVTANIPQS